MRAAALSWTLVASALAGCTLAFPLDDLQDGAGAGATTPSSSGDPTTSTMTSSGGTGQGAGSSTGGAGAGGGPGYADAVLADGPLLYFRMAATTDEPNLGTNTLVSAPHVGPHAAVATVVPGSDASTTYDDPAHGLDMTGEDDSAHLEVPALTGYFDAAQPFTVELWLRLPEENTVESADLFKSDDTAGGVLLRLDKRQAPDGLDKISFGFRDTSTSSFDLFQSYCYFDDWADAAPRHFVAVYDPMATFPLAVFMNGARCDIPANQVDGMFAFPTFDAPLTFGNGWSGAVDEIAVYDAALSPAKICAHYVAGGGTCN